MEEEENTASASNKGYFRDQLSRVRPELIKRITAAVLKGLLDKLQAHSPPVINNEEAKEILQRSSVEQDQVRSLVDVVDKKGDKACEILMSYLKELDNYLYQDLDLVPPTDKGRDVMEMSSLKQTVQSIFIEKFGFIPQDMETGKKQKLQDIFTDICIIEGLRGVNDEHELSAMDARLDETRTTSADIKTVKLSDIFSDHYVTGKPVRKVLTLGIAGGGKTFAVQKFVLDWAEGTQNQNIHLVFVLPFRELNMHTDKDYSLFGLLQKFYPDCEELTKAFANKKNLVLFVLDGLDESRMELFKTSISDPTKETSIAELITSLITGDLLSSALIWVTSRPAATNKKIQDCFDVVTEIQGFSECQREEYFERAVPGKAEEIIEYLKEKRNLFLMCNVPVFCHITAVVLGEDKEDPCLSSQGKSQSRKKTERHQGMPKTLTEMYAHYCLLQIRRMNEKYFKEEDKMYAEQKGDLLIKLGALAFKYLEKGTVIFSKEDLRECGIDEKYGALQAGLCAQIFRKENAESGESMFSFVHLSVQEFLAALYMLHMHATGQTNIFLTSSMQKMKWQFNKSRFNLYKVCLKKALLSQNGHLDLFVRFLLGLAQLLERPEIKHPLDGILPHLSEDVKEMSITKTVDYIKRQINKSNSSERIINLFHCLNELGDNSMIEAIDSTDDCGQVRLNPGLRKYACDVTLDPGTASRYLSLSEGNRKVTNEGKDQRYPDHEDRFEIWHQVLCREGLSGHCYWEAEWSGDDGAGIAVAYKSIQREGDGDNVIMGWNAKSWALSCSTGSCAVYHNNKRTAIPATSSRSRRVGVYLDWLAGTLSFYSVSSGTLTHLHTFHCTFTEPLYPGFTVWGGSSVSLCQIT